MKFSQPQPVALVLLAFSAILSGGVIGATTNAINGAVSPWYFQYVMHWHDVQDIWRAAIAQGIFEGLIFGVLFAVIFTLVVGVASRGRCPYFFAAKHLVVIVAAVYGCWTVGGLLAMGLASLSPEFYRVTFRDVPASFGLMLGYAWVGGSIWGAMFGGSLSLIIGSIAFTANWRRLMANNQEMI